MLYYHFSPIILTIINYLNLISIEMIKNLLPLLKNERYQHKTLIKYQRDLR